MKRRVVAFIFVAMMHLSYSMNDEIRSKHEQGDDYQYESFRRLTKKHKKHNSNMPKCCQEKCYAHRCCLPLYYLLSCVFQTDENIPLECCGCDNPDEKF